MKEYLIRYEENGVEHSHIIMVSDSKTAKQTWRDFINQNEINYYRHLIDIHII